MDPYTISNVAGLPTENPQQPPPSAEELLPKDKLEAFHKGFSMKNAFKKAQKEKELQKKVVIFVDDGGNW